MHPATVSIIIPNYNHALFLHQRIESVLNQTYQDFEVLIMDDCSSDHSRAVIEQYRNHPRISKIIFNDRNSGGVFRQWIKGINLSAGTYIWIAESDDYAAPTFLEETVRVLEKDQSAGMVFTGTRTVTGKGEFLRTSAENKAERYDQLSHLHNTIDKENVADFLIADMIVENASSVLFRKEDLLTLDFTELAKFINTGDRFVYTGIALQSKVLYLPEVLNFMRSHEHNTTKKSFENGNIHRDRLRVIRFYFDQLKNSKSNLEALTKFYKNNYIYFVTYGELKENLEVLENLNRAGKISKAFYWTVRGYLNFFNNSAVHLPFAKGIYYRFMTSFHYFDNDCQK